MNKNIFIIPGFKEKIRNNRYLWLKNFLKEKGFSVFIAPIKWNYKTMNDYVSEFKTFYEKHKSTNNYILGFSYGAVIALLTANDLKPKKLYLCSLSPDFKEDMPNMKKWLLKYIGKRRIGEIKKRSGKEIAQNLKISSIIFYGEKEAKLYPQLKIRCEETAKLANNSKLIIVKNAPHRIDYKEYKNSLKQELKKIH